MTGPELAARARALIPMLAENAVEAEKQRKPVDFLYSKRLRSERGSFPLSGQPISARLA